MKAARDGVPMDSQVAEALDDRKFCPHCKRKFNALAADRHIPLCAAKRRSKGIRI